MRQDVDQYQRLYLKRTVIQGVIDNQSVNVITKVNSQVNDITKKDYFKPLIPRILMHTEYGHILNKNNNRLACRWLEKPVNRHFDQIISYDACAVNWSKVLARRIGLKKEVTL